jgi:hypothetical protein
MEEENNDKDKKGSAEENDCYFQEKHPHNSKDVYVTWLSIVMRKGFDIVLLFIKI